MSHTFRDSQQKQIYYSTIKNSSLNVHFLTFIKIKKNFFLEMGLPLSLQIGKIVLIMIMALLLMSIGVTVKTCHF